MGALVGSSSSHKRDHPHSYPYVNPNPNLYPNSNSNYNSPDSRVSKKPRISFMHLSPNKQTLVPSNNTVARISRYPETTPKFRREVHAPCRVKKFALSKPPQSSGYSVKERTFGGDMGNSLLLAKKMAFGTFRYWGKDKGVVDVEAEHGRPRKTEEIVSEDSIVEEVEVMEEDGREWRSMVLERKSGDEHVGKGKGKVDVYDDDDDDEVRIVEERSVITVDGNMGVESAGKMLDTLTLDSKVDFSSVEVYKKLLESSERRDGKLQDLAFQIRFNEEKRSSFQLLRPKAEEKPAEDVRRELFIPLTKEEEAEVKRSLSPSSRWKVLVTHKSSNIDITGQILQCLQPRAWLNDEVINLYLELLKEREKREPQKFLKCHFFNTFFYKKLTGGGSGVYDYKAVRRWTTERKLGYFLVDCEKIFVPVHREIHWCLAIINKKDQKFQYLDSLMGEDMKVLKNLAKYYAEEVKDKSKKDIDVSSWGFEFLKELPEQQNGYDCGVFMIKYADFYSRGLPLCFGQEDMPYFRLRTAKEILRLRAD